MSSKHQHRRKVGEWWEVHYTHANGPAISIKASDLPTARLYASDIKRYNNRGFRYAARLVHVTRWALGRARGRA